MRSSLIVLAAASSVSTGRAVAQDGDAVGDLGDLVQLVRDQDRGDALRLEARAAGRAAPALSLSLQARGRLVEDQQLDLLGQRLGDLDQLLLADAEVGDRASSGASLQADLRRAARASRW